MRVLGLSREEMYPHLSMACTPTNVTRRGVTFKTVWNQIPGESFGKGSAYMGSIPGTGGPSLPHERPRTIRGGPFTEALFRRYPDSGDCFGGDSVSKWDKTSCIANKSHGLFFSGAYGHASKSPNSEVTTKAVSIGRSRRVCLGNGHANITRRVDKCYQPGESPGTLPQANSKRTRPKLLIPVDGSHNKDQPCSQIEPSCKRVEVVDSGVTPRSKMGSIWQKSGIGSWLSVKSSPLKGLVEREGTLTRGRTQEALLTCLPRGRAIAMEKT